VGYSYSPGKLSRVRANTRITVGATENSKFVGHFVLFPSLNSDHDSMGKAWTILKLRRWLSDVIHIKQDELILSFFIQCYLTLNVVLASVTSLHQ